jgi:hypothetical protein
MIHKFPGSTPSQSWAYFFLRKYKNQRVKVLWKMPEFFHKLLEDQFKIHLDKEKPVRLNAVFCHAFKHGNSAGFSFEFRKPVIYLEDGAKVTLEFPFKNEIRIKENELARSPFDLPRAALTNQKGTNPGVTLKQLDSGTALG